MNHPWETEEYYRKRAEARKRFPIPIKTNADRLRAMNDEELDKFLSDVQWDVANFCGGVTEKQEYPVPEQRGAWLDWLKSPCTDFIENKIIKKENTND